MAGHSLDALGAKVEQLEKITTETAAKVDNIALIVARIEERDAATAKQLDALFRKVDGLVKAEDAAAMLERLTALEKEPADRWKGLTGTVLVAFASGLVAWILSGILGGTP